MPRLDPHRGVLLALSLALAASLPLAGQDDVPDVLSEEPAAGVESVDLTTSPARIGLRHQGKTLRLVLGRPDAGVTLVEASRTQTFRATSGGAGREAAADALEAIVFDAEQRSLSSLGAPGSVTPSASVTTGGPDLELVTVARRASGRLAAVLRSPEGETLVDARDTVGGWQVGQPWMSVDRHLAFEGSHGLEILCRERVTVDEGVALSDDRASSDRGRRPAPREVTLSRRSVRETLRAGPEPVKLLLGLRTVCALPTGEAVVLWRGEATVLSPGDSVGPWRLERAALARNKGTDGRGSLEHRLTLTDLLRNRKLDRKVVDHYRGGRFESRDDPQLEKRPDALSAPGTTDLPDLGL